MGKITKFLANRTNGRAFATVLRLSTVVVFFFCRRLSETLCIGGAS